jgi:hypothetical protein
MTEVFSAIKIEAYLNSAWVDLTPDVMVNPAPRVSGIGFSSHAFTDVVGDAGTFTFSLDNSTANSGATLGYYTPQGDNRRSGWGVGVKVRLYFEYDGYRRYKFYGYIDNDGIQVDTGRYRSRKVHVTASNWLKWAADQSLALMQRQTNLRIDQAVWQVLENCTRQPLRVELYQGDLTFPTVFDNMSPDTKAIAELQKLAISELGRIFIKGDDSGGETLVVANKNFMSYYSTNFVSAGSGSVPVKNSDITDDFLLEDGSSFLLLESGDNLLLDNNQAAAFYTGTPGTNAVERDIVDVKVSYSKYLFNRAKLTTYPRTVDGSNVVLWNLDEPIEIAAGETIDNVRGQYKDPNNDAIEVNGYDMVTPVATTDYLMNAAADGSGANRTSDLVVTATYGSAEVSYSLTNNNASTSYITFLQARGKGIYIRDKTEKVYDSTTSQASYGVQPITVDFPYVSNMDDLFTFAPKSGGTMYNGGIFTNYDQPNMTADVVTIFVNKTSLAMMAFMFQEPGDTLYLYEHMTQGDGLGVAQWGAVSIRGYDFEIINGKYVKWHVMPQTFEITF